MESKRRRQRKEKTEDTLVSNHEEGKLKRKKFSRNRTCHGHLLLSLKRKRTQIQQLFIASSSILLCCLMLPDQYNPGRLLFARSSATDRNLLLIGQWPYSLKEHPEAFETIVHPGNGKTDLPVPKFWSPPLMNRNSTNPMPRDLAMAVGTCAKPDKERGSVRGQDCPLDQRTIFVQIASYRDWECRQTVESIFTRARHPERIRVVVVDQIVNNLDVACDAPIEPCEKDPRQALCQYRNQVDVYELEAQLSLGPVFARHVGYRMYRGEYYAMQTDAHITFVKDWDEDIIAQFEETRNEMAVLSTYLSDVRGNIDENGKSLIHTRPIMCNSYFSEGGENPHVIHDTQPEYEPTIRWSPQLEPWWGAGFSFSRGHFLVHVPYDLYLPMVFQGEEMSITLRGFTMGYDFYAPQRSICFHHYDRENIPTFWENSESYEGLGPRSMKRLLGIVHMNPEVDPSAWDHREEDRYGLGGVRTPEMFYDTFGLDVVNKNLQPHLCDFVEPGQMHRMFSPYLRSDGMGIDYSHINFKFLDPDPNRSDDDSTSDGGEEE